MENEFHNKDLIFKAQKYLHEEFLVSFGSIDRKHYINMHIGPKTYTFAADEARQIRDVLLEIYPLKEVESNPIDEKINYYKKEIEWLEMVKKYKQFPSGGSDRAD